MQRMTTILVSAGIIMGGAAYAWARHQHPMPPDTSGTNHDQHAAAPREVGQAAFAAIAEVVDLLESDSTTDWSKVDLERLRQHLIDMDEVTLRAAVEQHTIEGGIEAVVTGAGRTAQAIRRMTRSHARALAGGTNYRVQVEDVTGGVRVRVTGPGSESGTTTRIRSLGFIGIMTSGAHHGPHHLALARGLPVDGHRH